MRENGGKRRGKIFPPLSNDPALRPTRSVLRLTFRSASVFVPAVVSSSACELWDASETIERATSTAASHNRAGSSSRRRRAEIFALATQMHAPRRFPNRILNHVLSPKSKKFGRAAYRVLWIVMSRIQILFFLFLLKIRSLFFCTQTPPPTPRVQLYHVVPVEPKKMATYASTIPRQR